MIQNLVSKVTSKFPEIERYIEPTFTVASGERFKPNLVIKHRAMVLIVDFAVRYEDTGTLEGAAEEKKAKYERIRNVAREDLGGTYAEVIPMVVGATGIKNKEKRQRGRKSTMEDEPERPGYIPKGKGLERSPPEQREGGKKSAESVKNTGSSAKYSDSGKDIGSSSESEGEQIETNLNETQENINKEEDDSENLDAEDGETEKHMEEVLEKIMIINRAIIRETGEEMSFNRGDQQATQDITTQLTRLIFKPGKQETEIEKLKGHTESWKDRAGKLTRNHENYTNTNFTFLPIVTSPIQQTTSIAGGQRTCATITEMRARANSQNVSQQTPWTTPPKRHELIVRMKERTRQTKNIGNNKGNIMK
ncbi:hypothetical protein JTB14_038097 [Gonioctena quinquepunctata]|nr:hypothetical protein JTB14_038097 [Gonioctena quinquepunctata]